MRDSILKRGLKYVLLALSVPLVFGVLFQDYVEDFVIVTVVPSVSWAYTIFLSWMDYSSISIVASIGTAMFLVSIPLLYVLVRKLYKLRLVEGKLRDLERFHRVEMRRDPLTHIPNTRALKEFFELQLPTVVNDHRPVCLILLDLLDFGKMNDKFGEFNCDQFLKEFAPFIESQMRTNEPAFRISPKDGDGSVFRIHTGGDEFVILLRGTETDALFLLSRLMDEIWHESRRWGELLGLDDFVPALNISVYQMIHSLDWFKSLPSSVDGVQEIRNAFPRAADQAETSLDALKGEKTLDLRNLETLQPDDMQSLLTSLFELKRMSKGREGGLAYGSGMLSKNHKSYAELVTMLADQQGDFEFAMKKFRSSAARLTGVT